MKYPEDNRWYVVAGRFLNVLDADANMLSPVRIQAWLATVGAVGVQFAQFLTDHQNVLASGFSLAYAGLAHATHLVDKRWRSLNNVRP